MRIDEVFDPVLFTAMVCDGMVRIQYHPSFPLVVAAYTSDCMIAQNWNEVTTQCRGLIWNTQTKEVVARPFRKFFNHNDPRSPQEYDGHVYAYDKLDGSLGVGFVWQGKLHIATKGSFASDQAIAANQILQETHPDWLPPAGVTPLFEIIYPENRIVVDYEDDRELVFLAGISIETGRTEDRVSTWPGRVNKPMVLQSLGDVGRIVDRPNAEGFVVYLPKTDERIKFKQKDYLEKHKLVFQLSEKTVWKSLRNGEYDSYKAGMPDEFHKWMDDVAQPFIDKFLDYDYVIQDTWYSEDVVYLSQEIPRGDRFCREILADMLRGTPRWVEKSIWCLVEGQNYTKYIYDQFEPKGQTKVAKP